MKVRFFFAWYDFWIGWSFDREKRKLCVMPIPMFGFSIEPRCEPCLTPMRLVSNNVVVMMDGTQYEKIGARWYIHRFGEPAAPDVTMMLDDFVMPRSVVRRVALR